MLVTVLFSVTEDTVTVRLRLCGVDTVCLKIKYGYCMIKKSISIKMIILISQTYMIEQNKNYTAVVATKRRIAMTEKNEEVVITEKDIAKYLESTDADVTADKLHELVTNIHALVDRIQDLITEDPMLSAVGEVSFSAVLTVAGKSQDVTMLGAGKNIILGLHELANSFKELYTNKKEESDD